MEILLGFLILVILLDLAALRWGADSRERIDSQEWERRQSWAQRLHSGQAQGDSFSAYRHRRYLEYPGQRDMYN
jgi:hypothetical protein